MGIMDFLIAKRKPKTIAATTLAQLLNASFSDYYDTSLNDVYNACINAHARHASVLTPEVFSKDTPSTDPKKDYINRILSLRPNPTTNASAFWERVANQYYSANNAFIWIEWDYLQAKEPLKALWILDPYENNVDFRVTEQGDPVISFKLNGVTKYAKLDDVIHLARNAGPNILGESNSAIKKVLDIISMNYEGIQAAVKSSAYIRFIVKSGTVLSDDEKERRSNKFAETYLKSGSGTGVIYLDGAQELVPVESKAKYANADEMKIFEDKIYNYLGISQPIVNASFTEDQWQSYYESSLSPFINKLEQELTFKLFSKTEISHGNRIAIANDRLRATSMSTKIKVANAYLKLPSFRPNDVMRLLGMPITENGEKEYANLNFTNSKNLDEYQDVGPNKDNEEIEP